MANIYILDFRCSDLLEMNHFNICKSFVVGVLGGLVSSWFFSSRDRGFCISARSRVRAPAIYLSRGLPGSNRLFVRAVQSAHPSLEEKRGQKAVERQIKPN